VKRTSARICGWRIQGLPDAANARTVGSSGKAEVPPADRRRPDRSGKLIAAVHVILRHRLPHYSTAPLVVNALTVVAPAAGGLLLRLTLFL
jgi:hypothetical protein